VRVCVGVWDGVIMVSRSGFVHRRESVRVMELV